MENNQNQKPEERSAQKETQRNSDLQPGNKEMQNGASHKEPRKDASKPEHESEQEKGKQAPSENDIDGETEEETKTKKTRVGDSDGADKHAPTSQK